MSPMRTSERLLAGPGSALDRAILGFVGGRLRCGRLIVRLPDGRVRAFEGRDDGPTARVDLHDTSVLRRLAATGAIALGEGYIDGRYDSPDLAALVELGSLHMEPGYRTEVPDAVQRGLRTSWRRLGRAFETRGPVRDIVHHYDLGNDFYASWLDPTMTYSSAVFATRRHDARGGPAREVPAARRGGRHQGGSSRPRDRLGVGRVRRLPRRRAGRRRHHDDRLAGAGHPRREARRRGGTGRSPPRGAPRLPRRPTARSIASCPWR